MSPVALLGASKVASNFVSGTDQLDRLGELTNTGESSIIFIKEI